MRLHHIPERRPGLSAKHFLVEQEHPKPLFSAHDILQSKADALRGDLGLHALSRSDKASIHAKLAVLVPESSASILNQPVEPYPQAHGELLGQGHNLLLYVREFPKVADFLRSQYTATDLQSHVAGSFEPGTRPDVWPLLVGKALYPESGDWSLQEHQTADLFTWMKKLLKGDPSWADQQKALSTAADMVLLDPSLKPTLRNELRFVLRNFENMLKNIFGTSVSIIEAAYDLEVIFGEAIECVDELGYLKLKQPPLAKNQPLPERSVL